MATAQQQQQQQQEALADAALEDLHAAVFAARQVLQALAGPATGEGSAGPPSGAAAAKEEKPAASGRGPAASAAASAAAATTGSTQRGAGVPAAAAAGASGGDQWSVAEAQQVYLARTADLRVKVQQLLELRAAADAAAGAVKQEPEDAAAVAALQQRKQELISQVCAASELEATLMAQLRGLLDSFALWEAHKKHLETTPTSGVPGGR